LAKLIAGIATGAVEDRAPTPEEEGKDPTAVKRGRADGLNGRVRAEKLTPEERQRFAQSEASTRWSKN
jgi:hypothetical protein